MHNGKTKNEKTAKAYTYYVLYEGIKRNISGSD